MTKRTKNTKANPEITPKPHRGNKMTVTNNSNTQNPHAADLESTGSSSTAVFDKPSTHGGAKSQLKPSNPEITELGRKLFEEWEGEEYFPPDFEVEVEINSLEAQVGYNSLHRQLQHTFIKRVAYLRSEEGGALLPEEAAAAAYRECTNTEEGKKELSRLLRYPIDDLDFIDLLDLHSNSPRVAERLWERTKQIGRKEVESGHLAAHISFPVDGSFRIWLAEQQQQYGKDVFADGFWHRPMVSEIEAIDHASKMVDRFHRIYMRTLKQMSDHRKYSPVKITNANQVNIATNGGQQINIAGEEEE